MTANLTNSAIDSNFMQKTWAWLKAVDEAVNYDPIEQLHRRIDQLEKNLGEQDKLYRSSSNQ